MITAKLTKNTSKIPTPIIQWLFNFVVKAVNKNLIKKPARFNNSHYIVWVGGTSWYYKGKFFGQRGLIKVHVDPKSKWPCKVEYPRYKNMPVETFNDVYEAFVGVLAHEFAHHWFTGKRDGEFGCELYLSDMLVIFRKKREDFNKFLEKFEAKQAKKNG
jgi:hypothetical protein